MFNAKMMTITHIFKKSNESNLSFLMENFMNCIISECSLVIKSNYWS